MYISFRTALPDKNGKNLQTQSNSSNKQNISSSTMLPLAAVRHLDPSEMKDRLKYL